jgi:decaprenylphospho-beta-D-ribofuranose 2-oxidase
MKNYIYSNWGKNTHYKKKILSPKTLANLKKINKSSKNGFGICGNLRSFGDTCINKNNLISLKNFNKKIYLDKKKSLIEISSNCLLVDVLKNIIPEGYMLPVTPGSKYVTIGGMIANNVIGKNSKNNQLKLYIKEISILTSNNKIIVCTKKINKKIFDLTIGGFGLSGIILSAKLVVKKIKSQLIKQTIYKFRNIKDFNSISKKNTTFSVAWIDSHSLNKGKFTGLFYFGEYAQEKKAPKEFEYKNSKISWFEKKFLSFYIRNLRFSNIINKLFVFSSKKSALVNFDNFFYPQDKWLNFNDCYMDGLFQIQFLVAEKKFYKIIKDISLFFNKHHIKSTFIIIKKMNENGKYLNFKGKGYSISFDFEKNNNYSIIKKFFNEIFHNYQLQVNFSKDIIANGNLLKNNPSFIEFKKDLKSIDKKKNYKNEFSTRLQI